MRLDLSRKRARCTPVSRCTALCVAANFDSGPVFQNSDQRHDVNLAEPLRRAEAPELANGLVHPHRHTERLGFLRAKRDVLHHRGQPGAEVQRAGQHRIWHLVQCRAIGPEETLITFTIRSEIQPALRAKHQRLERGRHVGCADQIVHQIHQLRLARTLAHLGHVLSDALQPWPDLIQGGARSRRDHPQGFSMRAPDGRMTHAAPRRILGAF